ncbi:PLDc N-terminal domain-containing protein [Aeromicrobium sp. UC242_57]|uniref:PLDc N-terminal domain-containing protein n=1 Tax=Aeromicrobium sp. UC242_57 TaxID=3374624 RepID=UPI0037ADE056
MNFWESLSLIWAGFVLVAYLLLLFTVLGDLLRDHTVSGVKKAVWVFFLIIAPIITALVYLIVRGRGIAGRRIEAQEAARDEIDAYIRRTAGAKSPTEQITDAQALLSAGSITQAEFETLKAKALA